MEYINKNPKVFILSGKAKSGKDFVADKIKKYYKDKKCIELSYAYYLKMYAKKISDWDGSEANKPRDLLQSLGVDLVKKIDTNLLIRRVCEDIKVYSYFYDIIIITDARLKEEVEIPKKLFDAITLRIIRTNYDDGLTLEQRKHITETALDNYSNFDYIIHSETLENDLDMILKGVKI